MDFASLSGRLCEQFRAARRRFVEPRRRARVRALLEYRHIWQRRVHYQRAADPYVRIGGDNKSRKL